MKRFPLGLFVYLALLPVAACENAGMRSEPSGPSDSSPSSWNAKAQSPSEVEPIKTDGVFVPSRRVKIQSLVNGRVGKLSVVKGQAVSRQTLLFRIEDDKLSGELDNLRAQLQAAEAQLEQTAALSETEAPVEKSQEEAVVEGPAEAPVFEKPAYREPTFSTLASEIQFTSEDAGGVWPGIDPRIIKNATGPQDAGGVWPSYGVREMVNGEGILSAWNGSLLTAYLPVPSEGEGFGLVPRLMSVQVSQPTETASEVETPATPEASGSERRLSLDQANIDLIQAKIAELENELASRDIFSPVDGLIHELVASEGSEVHAGDFLAEVYQVNPLEFSFQIPKDQQALLKLGMKVKGKLSESPGLAFDGEISFIGAELSADTETVEVRAQIDNSDGALKVGMKGVAEIELGTK